jgi:hypothetical protein
MLSKDSNLKLKDYLSMVRFIENRIQEKLVDFDDRRFRDIIMARMSSDEEFYKTLNTPIINLPKYQYLSQTDDPNVLKLTLMDCMAQAKIGLHLTDGWFSFSEDLKNPIGFVAYRKTGNEIESMLLFSFSSDKSGVIIKDFKTLINREIPRVSVLRWRVHKGNTRAIQIYDSVIAEYFGARYPISNGFGYEIKGRK